MECRFVIWDQEWLPDPMQLTDHKCVQDGHLFCSDKLVNAKRNLEEELEEDVGFHKKC